MVYDLINLHKLPPHGNAQAKLRILKYDHLLLSFIVAGLGHNHSLDISRLVFPDTSTHFPGMKNSERIDGRKPVQFRSEIETRSGWRSATNMSRPLIIGRCNAGTFPHHHGVLVSCKHFARARSHGFHHCSRGASFCTLAVCSLSRSQHPKVDCTFGLSISALFIDALQPPCHRHLISPECYGINWPGPPRVWCVRSVAN